MKTETLIKPDQYRTDIRRTRKMRELYTEPAPYVNPEAKIVMPENETARVGSPLELMVTYPKYEWHASPHQRGRFGEPVLTHFGVTVNAPATITMDKRAAAVKYDPTKSDTKITFSMLPTKRGEFDIYVDFFDQADYCGTQLIKLNVT